LKVSTQYIHHSCYTLEIQNYFIVFDYFEGELHLPEGKDIFFLFLTLMEIILVIRYLITWIG